MIYDGDMHLTIIVVKRKSQTGDFPRNKIWGSLRLCNVTNWRFPDIKIIASYYYPYGAFKIVFSPFPLVTV